MAICSTFMKFGGKQLRIADLPARLGTRLAAMPMIHRLIVENVLRTGDSAAHAALDAWLDGDDTGVELLFHPGRIMMHDTTCVPALVDLAAARDALAEAGGDPRQLDPVLQVDVSIDHSIAVDHFAAPDAAQRNMAIERTRNAERLRLMKWATGAFENLTVHPPGTGIMHTLNLERLAQIVTTETRDGQIWAVPDTLIGTDSHTPMVNGIGVLGWGVGGLEAEAAMLGEPLVLRVPDIVGVRLHGALGTDILATDLALAVTQRLRAHGVTGRYVEFFGPGVATLSAGTRAVVANMAPEYGANTGYFPIDRHTLDYLAATGRAPDQVALVEAYANRQGLWFEPATEPVYADVIGIDLSRIEPGLAGPARPHDLHSIRATSGLVPGAAPVAIAAITSCTNTSDPRLLVAAGLLARNAVRAGLSTPAWVKTSLAPGSPAAEALLRRAGLMDPLEALGFGVVGIGCTTCIGNSGPLLLVMAQAVRDGIEPVAVLSGNRNFPGRVHPDIGSSFLVSPPMVVAFALAGDTWRDIANDPIGTAPDGTHVMLAAIWPDSAEIEAVLAGARDPADVQASYAAAEANPEWRALDAPKGLRFPWNPASTYLRPPPFVWPATTGPLRPGAQARPLLVLGDDITTDHISPAGAIPRDSETGRYLIERGEAAHDLNVYAARRGNWEAMVRGLFTNPSVVNHLDPALTPGWTIHAPDGARMPLWEAAQAYAATQTPLVIVAGDRYGAGSSRDWAAKGVWLLGVRAVLASSFERIHRSNLINMAVLPLVIERGEALALRGISAEASFEIDGTDLSPGCEVRVILRARGEVRHVAARLAVDTSAECHVLCEGGLLPRLLRRLSPKEAA
ncbi:aconitate hydratase AcnA [Sphingomonas sp.]|jgi:aconitate hydratase|uniref:aconitate hydratase AcnA n=1 Tax=Sphingomonas sp. TaxID=28214 RepID=UPI002ED8AFB1